MEQQSRSDDARVAAPSSSSPSSSQFTYLVSVFEAALDAHQAGRLDDAEPLYREALALDPRHVGALHYYGVLHHQRGNHSAAAQWMSEALELDRTDAACWSNCGLVAAALGHHDEALICYPQATRRWRCSRLPTAGS